MMSFSFTATTPEVRTMMDKNGEPWFVAKDVCDILELTNHKMSLQALEDDEKGVSKVYSLGGDQMTNIINESGLYNLIFRSNKPQAKVFRKWVTSEVLPSIRKQGYFGLNGNAPIPEDPMQAWALWPHLEKQLAFHLTKSKSLRDQIRKCIAVVKSNAPMREVPADKQIGLFAAG
ncbi:MAG: hypothetical protein C5B59_01465 [Bacteroidetes bacterium]|nr:MAG: hypothetical protein C5B59_01465 [Bacteroidota bacterium]